MHQTPHILLAGFMASVTLIAHAAAPAWQEGITYSAGSTVSYVGHDYQALVTHTAFLGAGWTPLATPTLWRDLGPSAGNVATPLPSATPSSSPTSSPKPTPSPTAVATQTPLATPVASTPLGHCLAAWQAGLAYTAGLRVSYQGVNYEAKWWSNSAPTNDQWGAWKNLGRCDGATPTPLASATPTVAPTASPTTSPTASPTSVPTASPVPTLVPSPTPSIPSSGLLFDDFSYTSTNQLSNNGWLLRSWNGGPGLSNGQWSQNNISFVADPQQSGNTLMRLKASTTISGDQIVGNAATAGTSSQVELMTADSIYLNGTWAARMYFNDAPLRGPDGDSVIQTFFGITRYIEGAEPYSEIDFEYLPNGGWGIDAPTMWTGTYEIAAYDPLNHVAASTVKSFAGWHTLVMNVADGDIRFFVDGKLVQTYSGIAQPDHPMFIAFQLWFSNTAMPDGRPGFLRSTELREYQEDVDWVLHLKDQQLSLAEVEALVANLRSKGLGFVKNIK
ncbi:carbohydrate-binding protein [Chitinibacter sp. GC72]|uniref:carbohydrate-binding protein n=1 Tax=Chitinibacter sp. GC72 TaxID=1526917 RepID=UPI0018DEFAEC|nr:carbohydrate-binding protein [Chitinibacter sp. GC72]